jgi:chemotaxis protein MotC
LLPVAALASEDGAESINEIRKLTQKFDKIANRDASAPADIGSAREKYGTYLRDAAAAGSLSQVLREHAEIFVLSGGSASILQPWEEGLERGGKEETLFRGIMAYGKGSSAEAERRLFALDATSFDSMRGGHLALAQALLSSRVNPERAFSFFDKARLLLPGTLVEEAALRQMAVLAAKTGNRERFASSAISYLSRFPRSAYVGGFEAQLAFHIARFPGRDGMLILQEILQAHPAGWGRCLACFCASIAEQALLLGKAELTTVAARASLPLVSDDRPEKQRLLLYYGAALIVTDDYASGVEILRSLKQDILEEKDRELQNASLAVAAKLRETPMLLNNAKLEALPPPKRDAAFLDGGQEQKAKAVLADADEILRQAK